MTFLEKSLRPILWLALILAILPAAAAERLRIACIGDSITYGTGLQNRDQESYPAQLQRLLGDGVEVRNFGNPGRGILKVSLRGQEKRAYLFQPEHQEALKFQPDIVVCNLGINDVDDYRQGHAGEFIPDYLELLAAYQALPGKPKLLIWTRLAPVAAGHRIANWPEPFLMRRDLETVARRAGASGIDLETPLSASADILLPDKIHPNAKGARIIAETTATILKPVISGDFGGLRLPCGFADHMMLQRGKPIPVWGTANAAQTIRVNFAGKTLKTTADWQGRWQVIFPPQPANAIPQDLVIEAEKTLVIGDILIGDVWLCAGQSNMAFPLKSCNGAASEILQAVRDPRLRLLNRACRLPTNGAAWTPGQWRLAAGGQPFAGTWEVASGETAPEFSGVAWFFARELRQRHPAVPVGLIEVAIGGAPLEAFVSHAGMLSSPLLQNTVCSRQSWIDNPGVPAWCRQRGRENLASCLKQPEPPRPHHPYEPSFIWESALQELCPFPLAGVVWYQGESNATTGGNPDEAMPPEPAEAGIRALIADWRTRWEDPQLPFLMVQLPRCNRPWMLFREVQAKVAGTETAIGLAVTTDLGDPGNVHPASKTPVGQRLAWLACLLAHQETVVARSPDLAEAKLAGNSILLRFANTGTGLTFAGDKLDGFELAGADGVFKPVRATLAPDNTVTVTDAGIPAPAAVRYNWAPVPLGNLFSREGLPAAPFRAEMKNLPKTSKNQP